jgi:Pyruvate/2-oxoacid:ferredoxin oxidoreductase delta subunit
MFAVRIHGRGGICVEECPAGAIKMVPETI